MSVSSASAVKLNDISLRFGRRWTLVRLNCELPAQRSILITGNNGAGKTTLLRVLATVLKPTRGEMEIFGQSSKSERDAVRRRLCLVTHNNYLYDALSAKENLILAANIGGWSKKPVNDLLERVQLAEHSHRQVGHFSAGMKRRLCLARLLLQDPELALLDEPFGQLDPAGVAVAEDIIRELQKRQATVVIVTHDHDRGKNLCDLHLRMHLGRIEGELGEIAA